MKVLKCCSRAGRVVPVLSILCISFIFIACVEKVPEPIGVGYHGMAYDAESDVFIVFGGQTKEFGPASINNMTWVYDAAAGTWTKMEPEIRPFAQPPHAMAYDSESDLVVLFIGETWTYDYNSNAWEKKSPESSPSYLNGARMAYDAESDRMILFGGNYSDETWVYDTNSDRWQKMSPAVRPGDRMFHAMTYDPEADRIIVFGGAKPYRGSRSYEKTYNDTWLYDYNTNTWEMSKAPEMPEQRMYHQICYCGATGTSILYGGYSYGKNETVSPGIWSYDYPEDTWVRIDSKPILTQTYRKHTLDFIPGTSVMMIVGGIAAPLNEAGEPPFSNKVITVELEWP